MGLKSIAREEWVNALFAEVKQKGVATRTLRPGGLTVNQLHGMAEQRNLYTKIDGQTVTIAKGK